MNKHTEKCIEYRILCIEWAQGLWMNHFMQRHTFHNTKNRSCSVLVFDFDFLILIFFSVLIFFFSFVSQCQKMIPTKIKMPEKILLILSRICMVRFYGGWTLKNEHSISLWVTKQNFSLLLSISLKKFEEWPLILRNLFEKQEKNGRKKTFWNASFIILSNHNQIFMIHTFCVRHVALSSFNQRTRNFLDLVFILLFSSFVFFSRCSAESGSTQTRCDGTNGADVKNENQKRFGRAKIYDSIQRTSRTYKHKHIHSHTENAHSVKDRFWYYCHVRN